MFPSPNKFPPLNFPLMCWHWCRSGQVVILKARPAMGAAVMSFHLSLSPTSSSSLTRFRPVVMPYNDNPALFKSISINYCPPTVALGVQQVVFLLASNYELRMATSLCSFLRYGHTTSFSFFVQYSLLFPALSLLVPPHCLPTLFSRAGL